MDTRPRPPAAMYTPHADGAPRADHGARAALADGQRLERAGAPERAQGCYEQALHPSVAPAIRAEAHRRISDSYRARSLWDEAVAAARRSADVAAAAGLDDLLAEALNAEGNASLLRGDVATARPLYERALDHARDGRVRGILLQSLGTCAASEGDGAAALELFATSLAAFRAAGYDRGVLIALNNVGAATIEFGDPAAALPPLAEAGAIARRLDELDLLLTTVTCEAEALGKLARHREAEARVGEALGFFATSGNDVRRAECMLVLAALHRAQEGEGHREAAVRCYAAAARLGRELGAPRVARRAAEGLAAMGASAEADLT